MDVQNWNYIKWMVTILPPWSSYNLTMVHRSNECVLARHPRDSHTNTRQEQQWRIKMYVSDVSLGGWYPPVFHTKRGSQGGFPPPWVSIHKFNVWLPPPLPGRATTGWFYIYIYKCTVYLLHARQNYDATLGKIWKTNWLCRFTLMTVPSSVSRRCRV